MRQHLLLYLFLFAVHYTGVAQKNNSEDQIRFVVAEKFEAVDGVKNGRYRYFCDEVQLTEGNYVNGQRTGYWEYFDNAGMVRIKGFYSNDVQHGKWKYYYASGALASEFSCTNGKRTGAAKGYYENGTVASYGIFADHEKDSLWITNYPDGSIYEEAYYSDGVLDSVHRYYENGSPEEISIYRGKNRVRTTEFLENGKKFLVLLYKNGLLHRCIYFNAAGGVIPQAEFADGNGVLHRYFYPDESKGEQSYPLFATISYVNGVANGPAEFFYRNGKTWQKGSFTNGYQSGKWKLKTPKEGTYYPDYSEEGSKYAGHVDDFFPARSVGELYLQPEFFGGRKALKVFLASVPYPVAAKANDIMGSTMVRFVVDEVGEVVDEDIIREGDHEILDDAAMEHLLKMPNWMPALHAGFPVKVAYMMPAFFLIHYDSFEASPVHIFNPFDKGPSGPRGF